MDNELFVMDDWRENNTFVLYDIFKMKVDEITLGLIRCSGDVEDKHFKEAENYFKNQGYKGMYYIQSMFTMQYKEVQL